MGKGDFVVRLVGYTKNYSSAMAQAKKSLEGFQQQNLSTKAAMSQLTSMLRISNGTQDTGSHIIKKCSNKS